MKLYHFTDRGNCLYNKDITIVCKDERGWINQETGKIYSGFSISDINVIISKKKPNFEDSVMALEDMGDKLNKDKAYYFTEGRTHKI